MAQFALNQIFGMTRNIPYLNKPNALPVGVRINSNAVFIFETKY